MKEVPRDFIYHETPAGYFRPYPCLSRFNTGQTFSDLALIRGLTPCYKGDPGQNDTLNLAMTSSNWAGRSVMTSSNTRAFCPGLTFLGSLAFGRAFGVTRSFLGLPYILYSTNLFAMLKMLSKKN